MFYAGPVGMELRMRHSRAAIASVLAVGALFLAGCGDSGTPMMFPTAPTMFLDPAKTGGPDTCDATNTTVRVSEISRPINHLMIEITNISIALCAAYSYPRLRFDDQAAIPAIEESRPQAVVEIAPGASAFAVIVKSAANNPDVVPVSQLLVAYSERNGDVTADAVGLSLPVDTRIGPAVAVSYWQRHLDQALVW